MYSKFCKMQEHVFKIYVHDSTIITDHQNMWKCKLRNIFCWENLQCCCYSNNILHFQSLLPHIFCFKRTFFFSFFILVDMLINFVIFMITIFVDQLFCQPLFSCHYLECWIWEKAWAFLYNLSCTSFFQKLQAICFLFLIFFLSGIGL